METTVATGYVALPLVLNFRNLFHYCSLVPRPPLFFGFHSILGVCMRMMPRTAPSAMRGLGTWHRCQALRLRVLSLTVKKLPLKFSAHVFVVGPRLPIYSSHIHFMWTKFGQPWNEATMIVLQANPALECVSRASEILDEAPETFNSFMESVCAWMKPPALKEAFRYSKEVFLFVAKLQIFAYVICA